MSKKNSIQFPIFVNVHYVTQEFGGREEGGWYFNMGTPEESIKCENQAELNAALRKLRKRYELKADGSYLYAGKEWHPNYDYNRACPWTATGDGGSYTISVQKHFARVWPEERPHYE